MSTLAARPYQALDTMQNDSIQLLAARLQSLQDDGIKINPATANPGKC